MVKESDSEYETEYETESESSESSSTRGKKRPASDVESDATSTKTFVTSASTSPSSSEPNEELTGASASKDSAGPSTKEGQKKKKRCLICKKRLGLTGFPCRCGGLFCSLHRYSDKHDCSFDYKKLGQEEISKDNPVVVAKKISKI